METQMNATEPRPGMRADFVHQPFAGLWIVATAIVLAIAGWALLPLEQVAGLVSEGLPVEEGTAVLYVVAAATLWWQRAAIAGGRTAYALCAMMLAFAARELDFHLRWTDKSVLKVSFYYGPAPLGAKLAAFVVLAVVAAAVVHLLRTFARSLGGMLRARRPAAVSTLIFIVTMVVAKVFDRSMSVARDDLGFAPPYELFVLVQAIEEMMELTLPLLAMLGLWQYLASVYAIARR
jgi:hypothetical protein